VTHTFSGMSGFILARRRNWKGGAIWFERAWENGYETRFSLSKAYHTPF